MTREINSKFLPEGWEVYFDGFEWVSDTGDGPAAHEDDDPMSTLFDHLAALEQDKAVATVEQIDRATQRYADDDINIDSDAQVAIADNGVWVQAWVWLLDEKDSNG